MTHPSDCAMSGPPLIEREGERRTDADRGEGVYIMVDLGARETNSIACLGAKDGGTPEAMRSSCSPLDRWLQVAIQGDPPLLGLLPRSVSSAGGFFCRKFMPLVLFG